MATTLYRTGTNAVGTRLPVLEPEGVATAPTPQNIPQYPSFGFQQQPQQTTTADARQPNTTPSISAVEGQARIICTSSSASAVPPWAACSSSATSAHASSSTCSALSTTVIPCPAPTVAPSALLPSIRAAEIIPDHTPQSLKRFNGPKCAPAPKRRRMFEPNEIVQSPCDDRPAVPGLPDEVLVRILQFVDCAPTLALFRLVSRSWCRVIDSSSALWGHASFKHACFSRPVIVDKSNKREVTAPKAVRKVATVVDFSDITVFSSSAGAVSRPREHPVLHSGLRTRHDHSVDIEGKSLLRQMSTNPYFAVPPSCYSTVLRRQASSYLTSPKPHPAGSRTRLVLGPRPGHRPLQLAASAGNEWASFLLETLFNNQTLYAATLHTPLALALVHGKLACLSPPTSIRFSLSMPLVCNTSPEQLNASISALRPPGWIVIHSARARGRGGALVGLLHIMKKRNSDSEWAIKKAVALRRPIYCAGFVGLWPMSGHLTELLIRAIHAQ